MVSTWYGKLSLHSNQSNRMHTQWIPTSCLFLVWFILSVEGYIFDPYIFDATAEPTYSEYDYVIVGGGAAGCPLTATLSEKCKVLLLERGGVPYDQPSVYRVEGYPWVLNTRAAQKFPTVDGVQLRRGNVLGGGSSVNAGLYSRAASDFIADAGWNKTEVQSAYEWVEKVVANEPEVKQWQSHWRDALLEAGVGPYNKYTNDHVIGTKLASSLFDRNGTRHTAANLLRNGVTANQRVLIYAQAHRVLFNISGDSPPKAYGVEFTDSKGNRHIAVTKPGGEVLLTAGTIGSTQLLLLSGVGPKEKLDPWNLTQIVNLESVGRNVTDIPINPVGVLSPRPVETSALEIVGILPENIFESGSGGNQSICYPQAGELNIQPPANRSEAYENTLGRQLASLPQVFKDTINQAGNMIQKVYRPFSRGTLKLASGDVTDTPIVHYNYLKDPRDVAMCVNGVKILDAVVKSKALTNYTYRVGTPVLGLVPGFNFTGVGPQLPNIKNYTESAKWCKDTVTTIWHFHGGCHRSDCVDSDYHVMGTENLRVVDGSTWLTSPGTNPQATCMMLGRYVGRQILREREANFF